MSKRQWLVMDIKAPFDTLYKRIMTMPKFTVRVKSQDRRTVWDEIEYGGDSTNSINQLHLDLQYMIESPENLAGPVIEIQVE